LINTLVIFTTDKEILPSLYKYVKFFGNKKQIDGNILNFADKN